MAGPIVAGWVAGRVGTPAVAFDVGVLLAGCGLAYWAFERLSEPVVAGRA